MNNNNFGIVVWGIRNGFKNNWLSANVGPEVMACLTDEMRQICNATIEQFFSIERTNTHTLLTVYNPNMVDHVQRKAYIAISLVVPNGIYFEGNVVEVLVSLMQFYVSKQGNAMVNMIAAEQLLQLAEQCLPSGASSFTDRRQSRIGIFAYDSIPAIDSVFRSPTIYGFSKVFFHDGSNLALEKIPGAVKVSEFIRPVEIRISDFNPGRFKTVLNNLPINESIFSAKRGDVLTITEIASGRMKRMEISGSDMIIHLYIEFPQKPPTNGGNPKPPDRKKMMLAIIGLALLGGLSVAFLLFYRNPSEKKLTKIQGTDQNEQEPQAPSIPETPEIQNPASKQVMNVKLDSLKYKNKELTLTRAFLKEIFPKIEVGSFQKVILKADTAKGLYRLLPSGDGKITISAKKIDPEAKKGLFAFQFLSSNPDSPFPIFPLKELNSGKAIPQGASKAIFHVLKAEKEDSIGTQDIALSLEFELTPKNSAQVNNKTERTENKSKKDDASSKGLKKPPIDEIGNDKPSGEQKPPDAKKDDTKKLKQEIRKNKPREKEPNDK
jgi:hypothetical protein